MYIKQITIQGFKSYKNQTIVDSFSPKHNVIVGRNGSGKSNFFAAMRFVLGDTNSQMGREDRQALLHEGTGSAVMSAYVEIIFDNTDNRFPSGKEELILRRTIGMKKDEYSIDRKNATKLEVQDLLNSAGFSRSNPYYIVPQGRITHLTNMKDSERLDLLKSVAGTEVYDEKKNESAKIMNETNTKLAAIDAAFEQINGRLAELEEEQEELRSFQEKDKERRGLEYTLYTREHDELNQALSQIEDKRSTGIDDADAQRERFSEGEDELARIRQEIDSLTKQMDTAKYDRKQLEEERKEKAKMRAQAELELSNLTSGQDVAEKSRRQRNADLKEVRSNIANREATLQRILPDFQNSKSKEDAVMLQRDTAETKRSRLFAKQGRSARFRSKKERDDYLSQQINDTFSSLSTIKAVRMQTAEEVKRLEKDIATAEPQIDELQEQIGGQGTSIADFDAQLQKVKEHREKLLDDRTALWRKDKSLETDMKTAEGRLRTAERSLSHMMDGNTSRGIESVRRIKKQHRLEGCYGTLAELIQVDMHKTAVEVTAGNSLFHYVVDTDATATKVLEILNKERGGRVTFMPLNRLHSKIPNFPNAQDAKPLISLIKYDTKYEKAVQHVFGKSLICQNLTVAAQYARTHGVNAVTPEGDRSDKKGALTGGYHDNRHSRLAATQEVMEWREKYETAKAEQEKLRNELNRMDQTVTKALGEEQKVEQQKSQAQRDHGPLRAQLRSKLDYAKNLHENLEKKRQQEASLAANFKNLNDQQNAYEAEKASDFKKALTSAEETELDSLSKSVQALNQEYNTISAERAKLEEQKSTIEAELAQNLQPRLEELEIMQSDAGNSTTSSLIKDQERLLARLNREFDDVQHQLDTTEKAIDQAATSTATLETNEAEIRRQQEELAKAVEKHQRRLEKSMQKRAALQLRKQEVMDDIRDIGAVPEEMRVRFGKEKDSEKLLKRLHKVTESLKKFTSVNKHAFEHYRKSVRQREELTERRAELEKSKAKIEELMEILDTRKDEAIQRTFKQVSRNFAIIFEKLVPAGKGELIIGRRGDQDMQADGEEDEQATGAETYESYTGIAIIVSFNSKHDEQQRIQQLSGGQKSKFPSHRFGKI